MTARCQNQQSQLGWLIFLHLLLIFDWRARNHQIKMSNYLSWSLCKKEFSPPFDTKITTLMSDWLFIALQTCNVTKEGEGIIKTFHLSNWYWYHIDIFLLPLWKCQSTEKQLCFYTRLKHLLKKTLTLGKSFVSKYLRKCNIQL